MARSTFSNAFAKSKSSIVSRFKYVHDIVLVTENLTDAGGATNAEIMLGEVEFHVRMYHFFKDFDQV